MTNLSTPDRTNKVSRRTAIKGIAGGTVAVAVGALATSAMASTTATDPILPLYERWRALVDESGSLSVQYREAEQTMPWRLRMEPGQPWPDVTDIPELVDMSPVRLKRPGLQDVRDCNRSYIWPVEDADKLTVSDEVSEAAVIRLQAELAKRRTECRARVRAWIRRYREQQAAYEAAGCNAIDRRSDAVIDDILDTYDRLVALTPTTPAGAAALLRLAIYYGVPDRRSGDNGDMASTRPLVEAISYLEGGVS